jgi:hypothetical protein
MKYTVKQGESKLVNGIWYNQGEEVEIKDGSETEILPVEAVKPKTKEQKKEEG